MTEYALGKMNRTLTTAALLAVMTSASAQEVELRLSDEFSSLRSAIESASLTMSLGAEESTIPQDYIAAARADYRRILTALYASGYYGASVSIKINGTEAAGISPLERVSAINSVEISVAPGPSFRFGTATVAPMAEGTVLPSGFATGEVAQSGLIKDAAKAAVDGWRDEGFAKANISDQSIRANHNSQTLDAALTVGTGARLSFGEVAVEGNNGIRASRIRDIAGIPEGETYSPKALSDAANRLRRSGAFSSVAITEADQVGPNDTLETTIQVDEATPRRFGVGAELSSADGVVLNGYWLHRNFLGGAESFRVEGEISGISTKGTSTIDYSLGYEFLRPQTGPFRTDFYSNGAIEVLNDPGYFLKQVRVEGGFSRLFENNLTLSAGLGVSTAEVRDDLGKRRYSVVSAPISLEWDLRDNPLDATSGYYLKSTAMPFFGVGAVDSGIRTQIDARVYKSFGENDRLTFAARGQLGSIAGASAQRTPADYLFYSGGSDTVRGQAYQSLGKFLSNNVKIGGSSLAVASLEARYDVTSKIGAVGFFDIGYIGGDAIPLRNGNWHSGTGLGLRYDTGIGPIRLDLATPANGGRFAKALSVYVGIGQSF